MSCADTDSIQSMSSLAWGQVMGIQGIPQLFTEVTGLEESPSLWTLVLALGIAQTHWMMMVIWVLTNSIGESS